MEGTGGVRVARYRNGPPGCGASFAGPVAGHLAGWGSACAAMSHCAGTAVPPAPPLCCRARTIDINVKDLEPINVIVCFAINVNVPVGGNLTLMTYGSENTYTLMCKVFPRHIDTNAILCRH